MQIVIATSMGFGLALLTGWTVGAGLVFGIALSVQAQSFYFARFKNVI